MENGQLMEHFFLQIALYDALMPLSLSSCNIFPNNEGCGGRQIYIRNGI